MPTAGQLTDIYFTNIYCVFNYVPEIVLNLQLGYFISSSPWESICLQYSHYTDEETEAQSHIKDHKPVGICIQALKNQSPSSNLFLVSLVLQHHQDGALRFFKPQFQHYVRRGELKENKYVVCWLNPRSNVNRVLSLSLDQGNFLKTGCQFYFNLQHCSIPVCRVQGSQPRLFQRRERGYFPMRHCSLHLFCRWGEQLLRTGRQTLLLSNF